jgi:hypothetical protein
MPVSRRDALKTLAAVPVFRLKTEAADTASATQAESSFRLQAQDSTLAAIADVVLPSEADRLAAVAAFTVWIAGYREGADTDHGYGNTRVRPTGPSPARNYAAQAAALDAAARARGAAGFASAPRDLRQELIEAAIADAKIERLPSRPTGGHIAADLMGHYFSSPGANDLCYRAAIGRDACRGLPGSEKAPAPLAPRTPRVGAPRTVAPRTSHLAPRNAAPRASRLAPRDK